MPVSDHDRTLAICDLLLGAAHADAHLHEQEARRVRELLTELHGSPLPPEVDARLRSFTAAEFDLEKAANLFRADPIEERRKLIRLVDAVHDADEERDLDEDYFLRKLGQALGLPADEMKGLTLEFEVEELRATFTRLRATPPPIPQAIRTAKGTGAIDVDVDLDE